ncbi:hypothetical protein IF2G_06906 [Cordyceps javanica]|nr:hypothetical protein IF2G_06906 [Cordyceps javanica]
MEGFIDTLATAHSSALRWSGLVMQPGRRRDHNGTVAYFQRDCRILSTGLSHTFNGTVAYFQRDCRILSTGLSHTSLANRPFHTTGSHFTPVHRPLFFINDTLKAVIAFEFFDTDPLQRYIKE